MSREYVGAELMKAKLERGCDAEIPSPAAYRPEQIPLVLLAHVPNLAVRSDHLRAEEIVASETKTPREPPKTATPRHTTHSRVGDPPPAGCQTRLRDRRIPSHSPHS